jgi:hypothetical protein
VLDLRCSHESHSQNRSFEGLSKQITVFCGGLPYLTPVCRDAGEVRSIRSKPSFDSLKLKCAMKQVQLSQFVDPARLLTYLLSRLVAQHSVEEKRI